MKAYRLGVRKKSYTVNLNYFDVIDTEEKAYWLGFIYADGFVHIDKSGYEFGVELSSIDIDHLEKLKKAVSSDSPITTRTRNTGIETSSLRIFKKEWVDSLIKNGVTANKTLTMRVPHLETTLQRHFVRGYFDGDGHVSLYKRSTYGYNIRTGFVCGTLDYAQDILKILNSHLNLRNKNSIYSENERNHSYQTTNKSDALLVLDFLYKDSNVYLSRKYEKYIEILNFIDKKVA